MAALTKRLEMQTTSMSKGMIGGLAGAGIFLFFFFIAMITFVVLYAKSSRKPNNPHLGPHATYGKSGQPQDLEAGGGGGEGMERGGVDGEGVMVERKVLDSSDSSASTLANPQTPIPQTPTPIPRSPPPVATASSSATRIPLMVDTSRSPSTMSGIPATPPPRDKRLLNVVGDSENRSSVASNGSIDEPATPGKDFV